MRARRSPARSTATTSPTSMMMPVNMGPKLGPGRGGCNAAPVNQVVGRAPGAGPDRFREMSASPARPIRRAHRCQRHPGPALGARPGHLGPADLTHGVHAPRGPVSPWRLWKARSPFGRCPRAWARSDPRGAPCRSPGPPLLSGWGLLGPQARRAPDAGSHRAHLIAGAMILYPSGMTPSTTAWAPRGALGALEAAARAWREDRGAGSPRHEGPNAGPSRPPRDERPWPSQGARYKATQRAGAPHGLGGPRRGLHRARRGRPLALARPRRRPSCRPVARRRRPRHLLRPVAESRLERLVAKPRRCRPRASRGPAPRGAPSAAGLSKYNVGGRCPLPTGCARARAGQVEDDVSCAWARARCARTAPSSRGPRGPPRRRPPLQDLPGRRGGTLPLAPCPTSGDLADAVLDG
jgi:hypothetical protein